MSEKYPNFGWDKHLDVKPNIEQRLAAAEKLIGELEQMARKYISGEDDAMFNIVCALRQWRELGKGEK